ncbi:MAG: hypothetical protein D3923_04535, partial [Candidatus Electrothrix sp. AR3]|nr:hypothetical protein [Candidatus Electrothrix sp. AR3]
ASRLAELKGGLHSLLDLLALFCKEVMTAILCKGDEENNDALTVAREHWSLQKIFAMIDAIDSARNELSRNCSRVLVCEVLLLNLFCG